MDVRGSCRPCMGAVPSAKHTRQRRSRPRGQAAPGPTLARLTRVPSRLESACSARSASRSARSLLSFCCAKNSAHSAARRRCSSPHLRMTTFCSSSKALWDKGVRARGERPGHVAGPAAERGAAGPTLARSSSSRSTAVCLATTRLCSSSARCVASALDCSALTRQRSCGGVRAEGALPAPGGLCKATASPTPCHKHLLS